MGSLSLFYIDIEIPWRGEGDICCRGFLFLLGADRATGLNHRREVELCARDLRLLV
jgi:hypothetical protein